MKALLLVPWLAIGCITSTTSPGTSSTIELGEPGRLALAGDCVVVAEHASLVCVPRAGGDAPHTILEQPARTFVEIATDGDDLIVSSLDDHSVFLDRIALDGTVTPLADATATNGAGQLAVADKQAVLSTGSQLLLVDSVNGGIVATLAQAKGVIGDVAVRASLVYYLDDGTMEMTDLAGTKMPTYGDASTLALAADASGVAVGSQLQDSSYSFVDDLTTQNLCELHGTLTRVALAGGQPYAIVDGAIFDASHVVARAPIAPASDAFDLAIDDQTIYWITRGGELDRRSR
jgi:hypothetical protein